MECLSGGTYVRLRSSLRGTYLHADENGQSVSLSADGASLNAIWWVELVRLRYLPVSGHYLSLQGAAYGRYLAVSPQRGRGHILRQNICYGDENNMDAVWMALRVWGGVGNEVRMRHCRCSAWHVGVQVQNDDDMSTRWVMEIVPWRPQALVLPNPPPDPDYRFPSPRRTIIYGRSDDNDGMIAPTSWSRMNFRGRSVLNLRGDLANLLGEPNPSNITLFVWTGHNIPRIPLTVDLPSSVNPIVIGVLNTGTPGENKNIRFAE